MSTIQPAVAHSLLLIKNNYVKNIKKTVTTVIVLVIRSNSGNLGFGIANINYY